MCDVVDGNYIAINHTTGERFNAIRVDSVIAVDGDTIRWPDNGWYQVQNLKDYASVCEGVTECRVPPGSYVVINHSSGERHHVNVLVDSAADYFTTDAIEQPVEPDPVIDGTPSTPIESDPVVSHSGCASCPLLPPFSPDASSKPVSVRVSEFGAIGSGQNEHEEIQRAVNAAGEGGRVIFDSGRVYFICKMLEALPGQLWQPSSGEAATLKRCNTPVTTLTADVSIGATELPVASVAGFETGMWISPVRHADDSFSGGEVIQHPVAHVSGNVLSIYNSLEKAYGAGDKVVTSFAMVRDTRDQDGVVFEGLVFDGNAQNNDHFVSWARHSSLWLTGNSSQVRHSRFVHSQGDAITDQGVSSLIEFNEFTELNGSAVHFSSAAQTLVRNNHMWKTNLRAERVEHAEAAITWSLLNTDIRVENNCIRDIPVAAFGEINIHGANHGTAIQNNQVCNTRSVLAVLSSQNLAADLVFSNNVVERGGLMLLLGLGNTRLSDIEISGNTLEDSPIYALDNENLNIVNNRISFTGSPDSGGDPETAIDLADVNIDSVTGITISGGSNIEISGNEITAGRTGIKMLNSNALIQNARVIDNRLIDQFDSGLIAGFRLYIDQEALVSDLRGVSASGNTVISNRLSRESAAVELGRGASFTDGCVISSGEGIRIHGYQNNVLEPLAVISNNKIKSDIDSLSITATSPYSRGIVLFDNEASNGIAPILLSDNPGAEIPDLLTANCAN